MEKLSSIVFFEKKYGHFYGQSFIKNVRGPLTTIYNQATINLAFHSNETSKDKLSYY